MSTRRYLILKLTYYMGRAFDFSWLQLKSGVIPTITSRDPRVESDVAGPLLDSVNKHSIFLGYNSSHV